MRALSELSLTEKIGQMVMCGFHGQQPSDSIRRLIAEDRIGGVIYFSRNIDTPGQVHRLSKELNEQAEAVGGIPLFIGIDQEGGMVARITEGVTLMPGNMALGAVGDVEVVRGAAEISGRELRALGINMNFAPSIDVNNNPRNPVIGVRSFGDDPEQVGKLGVAAVEGYREAGVCSVVKHFPGHGDTAVDSHFSLPKITHDRKRVHTIELVPFKKAIEHGTDMVMTAHVVFPALDEAGRPATLSPQVINGLLRRKLGYEGVVITDCLEMKAISETYGTEKAAVMAVEAGADIVLISHREDRQTGAIRELIRAVESGRISEERIDQSVKRILRLKQRQHLDQPVRPWEQAREVLQIEENQRFAQDASEKSITVIKDENHQLPLNSSKRTYVICPEIEALNDADEQFQDEGTLASFLSQAMNDVVEQRIPANPGEKDIQQVLRESAPFDQVVAVTYNASQFQNQIKLVRRLLKARNGLVVTVAVRNPFDFLEFPEAPTQIASYETRPLAMQSTARVLTGAIAPNGKLPVKF